MSILIILKHLKPLILLRGHSTYHNYNSKIINQSTYIKIDFLSTIIHWVYVFEYVDFCPIAPDGLEGML